MTGIRWWGGLWRLWLLSSAAWCLWWLGALWMSAARTASIEYEYDRTHNQLAPSYWVGSYFRNELSWNWIIFPLGVIGLLIGWLVLMTAVRVVLWALSGFFERAP